MKNYLVLIMSVFILMGCSVVHVSTDYNPKINFSKYKTYALVKFEQGDALINTRIDNAIIKELNAKSYRLVDESKADFIVLYRYSAKDKSRTTTEYVSMGAGRYGRYNGFYTTSTYHYSEGNFEIRMANPKTKDTFWRAEGVNTLKSLKTPEQRTAYTNKVVQEMLKKYPSHQ